MHTRRATAARSPSCPPIDSGGQALPLREAGYDQRGVAELVGAVTEALRQSGMTGVPHTPGTREYLTVEQGQVELTVSGELFRLERGDVVMFRGDQKHGYRNPTNREAVAYSVIAFSPAGGG